MPTEPNSFVDLIQAFAPVAGTFLTTIGGIFQSTDGADPSTYHRLHVAQDSLIKKEKQ